jgi:alpha-tubulin suppressor-like RCC1 family protein
MATTPIVSGVQYSGKWTLQSQAQAVAAGTWTGFPFLYAWGLNTYGGLGLGNTTSYSSPKQVGSLTTWLKISAGAYTSSAIKTDGTLWTWGYGPDGALGLGNITSYSSPKQVGTLTNWSQISIGSSHVATIKTDGTLWTWGFNLYGQLGIGNRTSYSSPKQVGALTTWSKVASGWYFTFGIKTDGTLWSWGLNNNGQLGINLLAANRSSPTQVGSLTTWLSIAGGNYHAVATKTDGTLWTWGKNNKGQIGDGTSSPTVTISSPIQIGALTNWLTVAAGSYYTVATKTDGTIWAWGDNSSGALGTGNITYYSSPKQIGALTTWSKISILSSTFAIKTDGTLWAWGYNLQGQMGLGNRTNYSSPKQVGSLATWQQVSAGNGHTIAIG